MKNLISIGFSQFFIGQLTDYEIDINRVGRVMSLKRGLCVIDNGTQTYVSKPVEDITVGDFCLYSMHSLNEVTIDSILERKSLFRRHSNSNESAQNICANMDTIFLLTSMNAEFKLNRIERYLIAIKESQADPVILLTKKDLCDDHEKFAREMVREIKEVPIHLLNVLTKEGLEELEPYLTLGMTVGLVGSSGVGKTSLINVLRGGEQDQKTQGISYGDRGRHTTTSREIMKLESGALVIDTPGMRAFSPVSEKSLEDVFDDIGAFARACQFRNCSHISEPGCRVLEAIKNGEITARRLENFQKLTRNQKRLANPQFREDERRYWKQITKEYRRLKKDENN